MSDFDSAVTSAVQHSFLAAVDKGLLSKIVSRARACEISAGRVFIDHSRPNRCGVIVSGRARVYALGRDGAQITVRRVSRGAAVGVRAMTGTPNALRVVAETDVEFLELDAATVLAGAQKDVSLAWAIAREVSLRLCDTEDMLQSGVGLSVMERVARALLDMAGELDGAVVVSQEALAERVGSSRESVGKTVRDLEARGLIQLSRRRLQVLDATTLASVAARD